MNYILQIFAGPQRRVRTAVQQAEIHDQIVFCAGDQAGQILVLVVKALIQHQLLFAVRRIVADWDGYSYRRGKNQFTYRPEEDRWKMLLWDKNYWKAQKTDMNTNLSLCQFLVAWHLSLVNWKYHLNLAYTS